MAFDIEGAKAAGYSTGEIADFLGAENKFDTTAARNAGYSDDELIQHLSGGQPSAEETDEQKAARARGELVPEDEGYFAGLGQAAAGASKSTAGGIMQLAGAEESGRELTTAGRAQGKNYPSVSDLPALYRQEGLWESVKAAPRAISYDVARTAPVIATGITAGALAPEVALGGLGAATLAELGVYGLSATGENINRQADQIAAGTRTEFDRGAAVASGLAQGVLEKVGINQILGRAGAIGERVAQKLGTKTAAEEILQASTRTGLGTTGRVIGGIVGTGAIEGGVEAGQEALSRAQAGESLTDREALEAYGTSALGGVLVGGAMRAPFATAEGMSSKDRALSKIEYFGNVGLDVLTDQTALTPEFFKENGRLMAEGIARNTEGSENAKTNDEAFAELKAKVKTQEQFDAELAKMQEEAARDKESKPLTEEEEFFKQRAEAKAAELSADNLPAGRPDILYGQQEGVPLTPEQQAKRVIEFNEKRKKKEEKAAAAGYKKFSQEDMFGGYEGPQQRQEITPEEIEAEGINKRQEDIFGYKPLDKKVPKGTAPLITPELRGATLPVSAEGEVLTPEQAATYAEASSFRQMAQEKQQALLGEQAKIEAEKRKKKETKAAAAGYAKFSQEDMYGGYEGPQQKQEIVPEAIEATGINKRQEDIFGYKPLEKKVPKGTAPSISPELRGAPLPVTAKGEVLNPEQAAAYAAFKGLTTTDEGGPDVNTLLGKPPAGQRKLTDFVTAVHAEVGAKDTDVITPEHIAKAGLREHEIGKIIDKNNGAPISDPKVSAAINKLKPERQKALIDVLSKDYTPENYIKPSEMLVSKADVETIGKGVGVGLVKRLFTTPKIESINIVNDPKGAQSLIAGLKKVAEVNKNTPTAVKAKELYENIDRTLAKVKVANNKAVAAKAKTTETFKYSVENAPEYKASHRPPNMENGAPLHDVTKGGEIYPADIYSPKGLQYYGTGQDRADRESLNVIKNTKNKPDTLVTMYRAVPKDSSINTINNGDWVTLSKTYAKEHGESALDDNYKIISKQVKANQLFTNGDSINEFGYWTEPTVQTTKVEKSSYSTAPAGITTGHTAASLSKALSPELKRLVASGKAVIHDTTDTLPGTGHPANVKGMTTAEGVTHYVANKLTPSTIESVALHEVGVHAGMAKMLGDKLWSYVKDQAMTNQGDAFVKARAAVPKGTPDHLVAEEALAYLVENSPNLSLVRQIVASIRNFLRAKLGANIRLSEADARQMAVDAMRREAKTAERTAREETAFSKEKLTDKQKEFLRENGQSNLVTTIEANQRHPNTRIGMPHNEVLNRIAEMEEFAKGMKKVNDIIKDHVKKGTASESDIKALENNRQTLSDAFKELADWVMPAENYETLPPIASKEQAENALSGKTKLGEKKDMVGRASKVLKRGDPVQLRLDIPAYTKKEDWAWVVSVHEMGDRLTEALRGKSVREHTFVDSNFGAGSPIGYEPVAAVSDVAFGMQQAGALSIAAGNDKGTIATIIGKWVPISPEEAKMRGQKALESSLTGEKFEGGNWKQIGMNPLKHSYFYDRDGETGNRPVTHADEVIQIGGLVLAKNVVYGEHADFLYSVGKDGFDENVPKIRKKANAIASFNREKLPSYLELFSAAGIREIGAKYLRGRPSEDGTPSKNSASEILKDTRKITGMTNKLLEEYLDLRKQINKYIKENRRQVGILGDTANLATILQVSPSEINPDSPNNIDNRIESELANQKQGYAQRVKDLKALKVSWGQLTPQSKAMYKKVADFYRESYGAYEEAERYRINSADMDADEKERQIGILDKKMEHTKLKGDYFPVMRFGNYAVQYTDGDIDEDTGELIPKFSKFESEEEAREFIDNNPSIETKGVTKDILRDNSSVLTGNRSLDALWKSVDKKFEKIESTEDIAIVAGEMKDYLFQMHLMGRPEQSIAKRFLHRKGTAGYSNDIFRSFDTYALSMSKQLPRIKLSNNIMSKLDNLKHELPTDKETGGKGPIASDYYNAFKKQITDSVYPKQLNGAINTITGAVFHYYLSAPASAALQLASIPLQGAPSIAKVHGVNAARRALNSAVGLYTSSMSKKTPFGDIKRGAEARKDTIGNLVTGAKHADEFNLPDAMDKMRAEGLLLPSVHAQAFSGQNKPTSKSDSAFAKAKRVMEITSRPFAEAESAARQVSAAAAYIANMRSGMTHQEAIRSAIDTTYLDLGDFGATGQSSLVKTGFGGMVKIASQFQQYGAKLLFAFGKAGYDALKGESPEVRRQGIKFLGSLYAMHWLFAGALGLPGAGLAMSLTDFIRDIVGDKDERHSLEQDMRNAMRSSGLNNTIVKMILDGPVGTITNMNLTPRIGAGDLIPMIQESDLNETLKEDVVGDFGKTMLGAAGSTAANIMKASEAWTAGNYEQAIEKIMPAAIRNVMTAHRYATEGKLTPKGLPIVSKEEISTWDVVARALGMETMHMAEKSKAARSAHMLDKFIDDRKEFLYDEYAKASPKEQEKVMAALVKFAERHPGAGVSAKSILSSLKGKERAKYTNTRGQMLGKNVYEIESEIPELEADEEELD